jgi:hypothetical protein
MASASMLPFLQSSEIGIYPASARSNTVGHDFCYDWRRVQAAAQKRGCNLDTFLTIPLASRLTRKELKSPVTFWYSPLGDLFVVTVCSSRHVNFFDPLYGLPGFAEYGGNYLRPTARPFLHWDGLRVLRVHALDSKVDTPCLVADFGNGFGLTVSESDEETYRDIQQNPAEHFEYSAVPRVSPTEVTSNGETLILNHVLCATGQS